MILLFGNTSSDFLLVIVDLFEVCTTFPVVPGVCLYCSSKIAECDKISTMLLWPDASSGS